MAQKNLDMCYVTSESVTEGHPDKVCDQIADGILDAYLEQDPYSRVAVEVLVSKDTVFLAGEITSKHQVDLVSKTREIIKNIGYTEPGRGFDYKNCMIFTNMHEQSPDISIGVTKEGEDIGGGDQGIMYGYASDETQNLMPLSWDLANKLSMKLAEVRKYGTLMDCACAKKPWASGFLYPDGKSQVTFVYDGQNNPQYIRSIVVSAQHSENIEYEALKKFIREQVIDPIIDPRWITEETMIHVNPTGRFVVGGPAGDTGVTGRKLMVDTYGSVARHGGGAFSGKDPTKVDRSAAYMARYVAKNIVAAGLAKRCEIAVAFVIGQSEPEAVNIQCFGTEKLPMEYIYGIVNNVFSFKIVDIIKQLELRKPQYLKTAAYGHFGREHMGFRWEETDKADLMRAIAEKLK